MVFWLTATSVVAYSILALLFKAAAMRVRSAPLVYASSVVSTVFGIVFFMVRGDAWVWPAVGLGFLAGVTFYFATIYRAKALATSPASLVFAISNLDLIIAGVVILLLSLFAADGGDPALWRKLLAVALAGVAVLLGAQVRGVETLSRYTYYCLGLLVISTLAATAYARLYGTLIGLLMLVDFAAGVIPGVHLTRQVTRAEWLWGGVIGIITFGGFLAMIIAQANASELDLPFVLLALNLKTPLTALLAVPVFKEQLTWQKVAAITLVTVALFVW